jgi:CDP-diacylglycerol--serine O-phosphatidyltransferase
VANLRGVFPGAFTAGNLFCGYLALLSCLNGHPVQAAWLVILAAFLDGLDGFVAKVSRGATRFGIELDSLADVVSFGAAPAVILYAFKLPFLGPWNWLLGAVFLLSGTLRLARFNLFATREEKSAFVGLPVPAAAVSLVGYMIFSDYLWGSLRFHELVVTLVIGYSLLMVSSIEFEARPRTFSSVRDRIKLLYILLSILAIILWPALAIFPVTLGYIAYGLVREGLVMVWGARPGPPRRTRGKKGGQQPGD